MGECRAKLWREIWSKAERQMEGKMWSSCEIILENDNINYKGREVGLSKVERRRRKDGERLM